MGLENQLKQGKEDNEKQTVWLRNQLTKYQDEADKHNSKIDDKNAEIKQLNDKIK